MLKNTLRSIGPVMFQKINVKTEPQDVFSHKNKKDNSYLHKTYLE